MAPVTEVLHPSGGGGSADEQTCHRQHRSSWEEFHMITAPGAILCGLCSILGKWARTSALSKCRVGSNWCAPFATGEWQLWHSSSGKALAAVRHDDEHQILPWERSCLSSGDSSPGLWSTAKDERIDLGCDNDAAV